MEGHILMSSKEAERIGIVERVIGKLLKQTEAAEQLGISERQLRRIVRKYREEGANGLVHKNRGRESGKKVSKEAEEEIKRLYEGLYYDFKPSLFCEKLIEEHGIELSHETIRKLLIKQGQWEVNKNREKKCHIWRERKGHRGEMVQMDGSYHDWFEGRIKGEREQCLHGYIDDATGTIWVRFEESEGVKPVLDSLQRYCEKEGIPFGMYVDRYSTYKTNRQATIDEELKNKSAETQVERICKELGIRMIHARSPQAKGRIERLFETLQDRLVKELRLQEINTVEEANKFLEEEYLAKYNKQFSISARETASYYKKLAANLDKKWTFAIRDMRIIGNDYTIRRKGKIYLLQNPTPRMRRRKVEIKEAIDGSLRFSTKDTIIRVQEITDKVLLQARKNHNKLESIARGWKDKEEEIRDYKAIINSIAK
jgi:transposase